MTALALVQPDIESLEADFTEDLHLLELAAVGILQAADFEGNVGALDLLLQVAGRTSEILDAAERMSQTVGLLKQHPEYRL